jgi:hypothetical protein
MIWYFIDPVTKKVMYYATSQEEADAYQLANPTRVLIYQNFVGYPWETYSYNGVIKLTPVITPDKIIAVKQYLITSGMDPIVAGIMESAMSKFTNTDIGYEGIANAFIAAGISLY